MMQGSYTKWESIAYSMQEKVKDLEAERGEVVAEFESGNIHEDLQLDSVWRDLISNNETYTIKVIKAKK